MKTKLMLMVALMCFVGADVSANTVNVDASADTYILYNRTETAGPIGPVDENFGGANEFLTENRVNRFRKSYIQFDASAYGSSIQSIESFSFYYTGSGDKIVGVWFLSPLDGIDDNWTELGITWLNAPYNDSGAYTDRNFNAKTSEGESLDHLTSGGNQWLIKTGWNTFYLSSLLSGPADPTPDDRRAAVLAGLLADGKLTIGLTANETKVANFLSREYVDDGTYGTIGDSFAPYMTVVVPEPATMVLLGLGSLTLLRKRK